MTKVIKIDSKSPEVEKITLAAEVIKAGGLVAFPTETVYGLGANALDAKAVENIFKAKGRPSDNPLIVHISEKSQVSELAEDVSEDAKKLIDKFWPGPLTLILKKKEIVPEIVTAGLDSVAIRMPSNKIAQALIEHSGLPIAAPSANLSGKPSPTSSCHAIQDLDGRIDLIIDGGDCEVGLESTVIDMTSKPPALLRPGKITIEQLTPFLGKVEYAQDKNKKPKSPGMKYKHYSPNAKVILIEGDPHKISIKRKELESSYLNKKFGIISNTNKEYLAKNLFRLFREFDKEQTEVILVEGIEEKGLGVAIMNRLRKAASEIILV